MPVRPVPSPSGVTVVGVGADGWAGTPTVVRDRILAADVLLGGPRHLAAVPDVPGQRREPWPSPLREGLPALLASAAGDVVVLASGDPLVSGIGTTLVDLLGGDAVTIWPAVSSVALARARMGWPEETTAMVTLVGRDVDLLRRELAPGRRLLVLSSDEHTPRQVASVLAGCGYGGSSMTVLGDLGVASESRTTARADDWGGRDAVRLHVLAVECTGPPLGGWVAGLPDDAYEHDGQLTKRDLRAAALARLAPQPGQLLWDVGAGAGSVGIEWARAHPTCRTVAVEQHPERAARVARNASRLGVPGVEVVRGAAPEALAGLRAPDAAFVGGGLTAPGVLDACLAVLRPGGRLVAHAVTLESEALLGAAYTEHGGELTRHQVETAAPLGSMTGWTPARAVTQWAWSAA